MSTKKLSSRKQKTTVVFVMLTILLIFLFGGGKAAVDNKASQGTQITSQGTQIASQGTWDISQEVKDNNLTQYLREELDFDYSDPGILEIAKSIKSSTATPYDAVKKTAQYVYDNIEYTTVTVSHCYKETAASTLESGSSDCVGMTRLNIGILRAMGIPARSVGGCLKSSVRCTPLFAVAPGVQAKVSPLVEGDFKKRGFLHEWVEVWLPTKNNPEGEWLSLEATAGLIYPISCGQYIKFGDGYDNNQFERCTISSQSFWNLCSIS